MAIEFMEELERLAERVQQALDTDDPRKITSAKLTRYITWIQKHDYSLGVQESIIHDHEDNPDLQNIDKENKRANHDRWEEVHDIATGLKKMYDLNKKLDHLHASLLGLEELKEEDPTYDVERALIPIDKQLTAVSEILSEMDLDSDELPHRFVKLSDRRLKLSLTKTIPSVKTETTTDLPKISEKSAYKLQPLSIPQFYGQIEDWVPFWGEFEHAVHRNEKIEDCTKLAYLKQAIKDKELKKTISDLGMSNSAYGRALELLEHRFNKPRILHRKHCATMKDMTAVQDTREGFTAMADKLTHLLTGFSLLEDLDIRSALTSLAELNMSQATCKQWHTATATCTKTPKVEDLIKFFREMADQTEMESAARKQPYQTKPKPQKSKHRNSPTSSVNVVQPQVAAPPVAVSSVPAQGTGITSGSQRTYPPCKYVCPLCNSNHYAFFCEKFKAFNTSKRQEHVNNYSLCNSCLKPGHTIDSCRSTYKYRTCKGPHNSFLHVDAPVLSSNAVSSPETPVTKPSLSMTAQVLVCGENGTTLQVRALLDSGAHLCMLHPKIRTALSLKSTGNQVYMDTAGPQNINGPWPMCKLQVRSKREPEWSMSIAVAVTPRVTAELPPYQAPPPEMLPHLAALDLADETYNQPGAIDLILGAETMNEILKGNMHIGAPCAIQTVFGWALLGTFPEQPKPPLAVPVAHVTPCPQTNRSGDDLLAAFFELEEPPRPKSQMTSEDQRVEQHYEDTHSFNQTEGRYQVKLPKVPGDLKLGESREMAVRRAKANERSLLRKEKWSEAQKVMEKYMELGHARPVSQADLLLPPTSCYYMPVHTVYKQSSSSTKVRAVFDASAQSTNKVSLNDTLAVGPTLQPPLEQTLIKFRSYPVALSGDISMMYREILLHPDDRCLHRFIWRRRQEDPWMDYEMLRVTFGVTSSPYLAVKTLQQAAKDFGSDYPEAHYHLLHSFYVDDFFGGAETPEAAIKLRADLSHILSQAGFTIKKWRSSSPQVMQSIPLELREVLPNQELMDLHTTSYPKALGLGWNQDKDSMATHVEVQEDYTSTKRGVVSDIARTFDVLGWLSPVILRMKMVYRELWIRKIEWDKPVPEDLRQQHWQWRLELPLLSAVSLDRYYFQGPTIKITLQGFSDASQEAFAGVVFVRATYSTGPPTTMLVSSKTKVAPLEGRSIPELELCGAHLLGRLMSVTSKTLNIPIEDQKAYCDNTAVLAWLDGKPKRKKTYVANRIHKTNLLLPPECWAYVQTHLNPADCASRGVSAQELLDHPLWWHGPSWLLEEPLNPPPQPVHQPKEEEAVICNAALPVPDSLLERTSNNYNTVVKITCWIKRFINKARKKRIPSDRKLLIAERLEAERTLQRRSQLRSYPREHQCLSADPPEDLDKKCSLLALHPQLNSKGLLCVGGRLANSLLPEEQKHPIILASTDVLTNLLFHHYHKQLGHGGPTLILSHSGGMFHVIGARRLARSICRKCVSCRKIATQAGPQLMGQLPPSRLDPDYVFFHTGVDYAGPYLTRSGRVRNPLKTKTYLAVFVCFHSKAVHLELILEASTEALVACLTRFCSRRGLPLQIHSDNGPSFIGANNELQALYRLLETPETQNAIESYLFEQHVTWKNIPQRAPHMGGLWEAAVKAAKYHLKRAIRDQCLTYEELSTIVCQVEACLNSRPLGVLSSHPIDGLCPLTPGHFLTGRALRAYPIEKMTFKPTPLQRWIHVQRILQTFWKRWSQEYLQQLQRAVKWHRQDKNYRVNDMVMFTDGNKFIQQWTMGRIIAVYPGRDGVVRSVDVQMQKVTIPKAYDTKKELVENTTTRTSVFRRPIHRLSLLLSADEAAELANPDAVDSEVGLQQPGEC